MTAIMDSDFRYIDKKGTLLKSRTELAISQMLSFVGIDYTYENEILVNGKTVLVDLQNKRWKANRGN